MKMARVVWIDAHYADGEHDLETLGKNLEPLIEYGLLVKETDECVTLSIEVPRDGRARNPFSIPKRNILEMRTRSIESIFKTKKS